MFERLQERLESVFKRLRGRGRLTESDVDEALREIRIALLEADVNVKVAKTFCAGVRERAVGQDVLTSLSPGEQVATIVYEQLQQVMGGTGQRLTTAGQPPTVYLLVGLQGSGKTTTAGKLARYLSRSGHRILLVAADVRRAAAVDQLRIVSEQAGAEFLGPEGGQDALALTKNVTVTARSRGCDVVIIDSAGRLHIDAELMQELAQIKQQVTPQETLLVADAMMGQDAVTTAQQFTDQIGIDAVILTKVEGDARGGAALSIKAVTGTPIKFVGTGERLDALEAFHPDRFAARILGMGDIQTLAERAEAAIDEQKAKELEKRLGKGQFTLEDFVEQLQQVKSMGPLDQLVDMIPGLGKMQKKHGLGVDEKQLTRVEAIINSMTPQERQQPEIINGSRRRRIAEGSGTRVADVNNLLKQFAGAKKMLKHVAEAGKLSKHASKLLR